MPCPVCNASATLLGPGGEPVKFSCGFTVGEIAQGLHQLGAPRRRARRWVILSAVIALVAILALILGPALVAPDHSTSPGSGYAFTLKNSAERPLSYSLLLDGERACVGELGTTFFRSRASCTTDAPIDDRSHAVVLLIEYADGSERTVRGEVAGSPSTIVFTDFGASLA